MAMEGAAIEALLGRLIERFWNGRDLGAAQTVFAADAVLHLGGHDHVGREAIVRAFAEPFMAAFPDLRHEVLERLVDGDRAAMRYRGSGHMAGDYGGVRGFGQAFAYHGIAIFRFAGGLIVEVWSSSDMTDWLALQPRAEAGGVFAVVGTRDAAWDHGAEIEGQAGWREHAAFMDALAEDGFALLVGPLEGTQDVLLIVRAADEAAVRARFAADPWHADGHLRIKSVTPWTLRIGAV